MGREGGDDVIVAAGARALLRGRAGPPAGRGDPAVRVAARSAAADRSRPPPRWPWSPRLGTGYAVARPARSRGRPAKWRPTRRPAPSPPRTRRRPRAVGQGRDPSATRRRRAEVRPGIIGARAHREPLRLRAADAVRRPRHHLRRTADLDDRRAQERRLRPTADPYRATAGRASPTTSPTRSGPRPEATAGPTPSG